MIKNKIIIVPIIFLAILAGMWKVEHDGRRRERADRIRLQQNQAQLMVADSLKYLRLQITLEEFKKGMNERMDSILKAEYIKPARVERIIERHYYYRDTSYNEIRPLPVETIKGKVFPFSDIKDCFRVDGYMMVEELKPVLVITNREFKNNTTDIIYLDREKRFLFLKFGKLKAKLKSIPECGEERIKEVEIVKNRRNVLR
ncbi:MAG: hypothetical protein GX459_03165 [Bacteroidales bacterium]|nr:hypothetical protein [Bacteroidales bacterium]